MTVNVVVSYSIKLILSTLHSLTIQDEAQVNVARDIAVQMCDVFEQKDYVGVVNVSYMAAVSTFPDLTAHLVGP